MYSICCTSTSVETRARSTDSRPSARRTASTHTRRIGDRARTSAWPSGLGQLFRGSGRACRGGAHPRRLGRRAERPGGSDDQPRILDAPFPPGSVGGRPRRAHRRNSSDDHRRRAARVQRQHRRRTDRHLAARRDPRPPASEQPVARRPPHDVAPADRAHEERNVARAGARGDVTYRRVGDSRVGEARRAQRDQGSRIHTRVRLRRAGTLRRSRHVRESARRAHARRRAAPRHRLRERGQSPAGARRRPATRDVAASGDRCQPGAHRAPTADREPPPRAVQRRGGAARRVVGEPRPRRDGVARQSYFGLHRANPARPRVHVRPLYRFGFGVRPDAGAARVASGPSADATLDLPLRGERRAIRDPAHHRAGGALARAARRRVDSHEELAANGIDPARVRSRPSDRRGSRRCDSGATPTHDSRTQYMRFGTASRLSPG